MPNQKEIGRRLRTLRLKKGIGVQKMADKCGVSRVAINLYERGERGVKDSRKKTVASILGKSVQNIFFEDKVNY